MIIYSNKNNNRITTTTTVTNKYNKKCTKTITKKKFERRVTGWLVDQ